jgi:alpha-glucosidase
MQDRIFERQHLMTETIDTSFFTPLQLATAWARTERGIQVSVDHMSLQVDILRPDLLRLRMQRQGDDFDDHPTYAVSADLNGLKAPFELHEDSGRITLTTDRLSLIISLSPFRLDAYRADGSVIFETATVNGHPWAYASLNDEFQIARTSAPDDSILGLGEKTGRLNRNGRGFTLWNTDVLNPNAAGEFIGSRDKSDPRSDSTSTEFDPYYISIPFFQHINQKTGYAAGFFMDNGYRGRYEFQHEGQYRIHFSGGQYTEYVFAGPSLKDILGGYTQLTGRMSLPPLWALGYHQCRWYPYTQDDVETLAERYREKKLPCDALWLDIEYMNGYRVFTWNETYFPEAAAMLRRLDQQGFRAITIIDPGVKAEPGYEVYDDGMARDIFCKTEGGAVYTGQVWPGKTAFPDFSLEEGRRWWGERNAAHIQSGLAGIWNDMNEPATGAIECYPMRFGHGKYPHERFHNQYALLMAMATQEGLRAAMPALRTFVLSRAGSAGIQRYAANWMGDNMARWDHLEMSVSMALGLGLSGQPFVGADLGGFAEDTNPELFIRWVQCGVLTAFCRNHNNAGCIDQYPWSFGPKVEEMCRRSLNLRYRLMPMIYTAFWESAETGLPVQRPLALEYQEDLLARAVDNQYLLGRHLLVAPVSRPKSASRSVYLPSGTWHHWFTGEVFRGGKHVTAKTPPDQIPVYARGGSVIPLWPGTPQSTKDYHPQTIELHVFIPEEDGVFQSCLREDDGLTDSSQSGAFVHTEFILRRIGRSITLDAAVHGNGYPEFKRRRFEVVLHGSAPSQVYLNQQEVRADQGRITVQSARDPFYLHWNQGS